MTRFTNFARPINPKGAASEQLVNTPSRQKTVHRRPYGTDWEELDLETAMEMITDRFQNAGITGKILR